MDLFKFFSIVFTRISIGIVRSKYDKQKKNESGDYWSECNQSIPAPLDESLQNNNINGEYNKWQKQRKMKSEALKSFQMKLLEEEHVWNLVRLSVLVWMPGQKSFVDGAQVPHMCTCHIYTICGKCSSIALDTRSCKRMANKWYVQSLCFKDTFWWIGRFM